MFDNVTTETIHTTHRHNRTVSFGRSLEGGAFVVKLLCEKHCSFQAGGQNGNGFVGVLYQII